MNSGIENAGSASTEIGARNRKLMVAALMVGAFVSILNETLLNVAYPVLMRQFEVSASAIQWLSSGYMLVVGILVPVTALLLQWFTTRRMFMTAMAIFVAGTALCATAPWFGMLLFGRIVQAFGTGLLLPVLMATILAIYPPEKRGGAMGLIGLVVMFAPAIGPTLSGMIVDGLSWRWLFYLVAPLAVFSIVLAGRYLINVSEPTRPKADAASILLSSIGFGGIVYGLGEAAGGSWAEPSAAAPLLAGAAAIVLFARRQSGLEEPVLELRIFRYRAFAVSMLLIFLQMMLIFSTMIILPLFFQTAMLMTAFASGLALMPGGILNGIMAPVSGRLFDRFGPRFLVAAGLALVALANGLFIGVDFASNAGYVVFLHALLLTGFSTAAMPLQTMGMNALPQRLHPHGTAVLNTLQQMAGAIGTALFVGILSAGTEARGPGAEGFSAGMRNAYAVGFALALVSLAIGLFVGRGNERNRSETGSEG